MAFFVFRCAYASNTAFKVVLHEPNVNHTSVKCYAVFINGTIDVRFDPRLPEPFILALGKSTFDERLLLSERYFIYDLW